LFSFQENLWKWLEENGMKSSNVKLLPPTPSSRSGISAVLPIEVSFLTTTNSLLFSILGVVLVFFGS